ncbi:diguanylate cyclase (GGDEF)-like protein [Natronospira proteinivora]|uniref:diguanylate cyclase n=1 Tax=Natronospira proteinivora TaxID=1807133 RepID=A0ABT1G8X0_9GAMM|nr:diguanylate cyclase (GGDEF)-like protein [Natronospira proteinivora]
MKTIRPRPISTLLVMVLLSFSVVLALVLAVFSLQVHWQSERMQAHVESALFESIQAELQATYGVIEPVLESRRQAFLKVHQAVLTHAEAVSGPPDIEALQRMAEDLSGVPTDIYLINPELQVIETTYPPDQDLDFSHPGLFDGRYMIERAHQENDIVVSAPVLEMVSREFRIYSYSPLGDSGYTLELGFVSPMLDHFFQNVQQRLSDRQIFQANLHFLMWDDWLLSLTPDRSEGDDKAALLEEHYQAQQTKIEHLRAAKERDEPVRILDSESGSARHYIHLMDIPTEETWDISVMAAVEVQIDAVQQTRQGMTYAASLAFGIILLLSCVVFLIARKALANPLAQAAADIEAWRPVRLKGLGRYVSELQLLTSHFNSMLSSAHSRIQGLGQQARTDSLTGLANRASIESELAVEIQRSERYGHPLSVILMDLDHFKRINDHHGHLAGDEVLQKVAKTLTKRARRVDTVGRWGGEEFVIICRDTELKDATQLAESLREDIGDQCACTASFGVVDYQADDTLHNLFHRADEALYVAKSNGRNQVSASPRPA